MSYFHSLRKKSNRRANCLDSFGYSCCCCLFDDDDANGDNDDDDDDVSLVPQLMILLRRLTLLSNDHDCDFGCDCECDCDCDCGCECDCKCDCNCASECYYYRFSFNFAKRKRQAKKNNLSLIWMRTSTGRCTLQCTLHAVRCTLQAASGSRQFAIESRCLKNRSHWSIFKSKTFPKAESVLKVKPSPVRRLWDHVLLDTWNISTSCGWICNCHATDKKKERQRKREIERASGMARFTN